MPTQDEAEYSLASAKQSCSCPTLDATNSMQPTLSISGLVAEVDMPIWRVSVFSNVADPKPGKIGYLLAATEGEALAVAVQEMGGGFHVKAVRTSLGDAIKLEPGRILWF